MSVVDVSRRGWRGTTDRCRLLYIVGWVLHHDRSRIGVVGVVRVVPVRVRAPAPPVGRADTDEDAAPEMSVSVPATAPSLAGQDDAQDEGARDEKDRGNLLHAMAKASAQTQLLVKLRVVKMRALRPDEGPTDNPEGMDFGLAGRIGVVTGAGVFALAALNAGLILR